MASDGGVGRLPLEFWPDAALQEARGGVKIKDVTIEDGQNAQKSNVWKDSHPSESDR